MQGEKAEKQRGKVQQIPQKSKSRSLVFTGTLDRLVGIVGDFVVFILG